MKSLIKIIMAILGILGLSGKASAKKKAEVKKIDKRVRDVTQAKKAVKKKKTAVRKKKATVTKAVKTPPKKKPNVKSAKKASSSLKKRARLKWRKSIRNIGQVLHELLQQKDIFDVLEIALLSWICFLLMKLLFSFGAGIEALSEIDKVMRGY